MTYGLEGRCSIQLSYWRSIAADRDGRIRTGDPSLPKRVLYRAEPRPETTTCDHRADRVGFEPTRAINPTRFPIVLLKPLGHRSQRLKRRGRDSNPRLPFGQDGLANRWF